MKSLVPPHIDGLSPYQPGKPIEDVERELGITGAIKLASNENPLGPSPRGIEAARRASTEMHFYPDGGCHRLREALSRRFSVSKEEVVPAAGSNELIELLVRTFCEPGKDEVLSHAHAFVMYKLACFAHQVKYVEAPVRADLACDVDALAAAITPATRMLFLPNPNNPTGHHIGKAEFERLLERVPREVILVVDEAYFEYASVRADYPVAERYRSKDRPWIVTLRTFSKIYGLAGLRVGYALCDARLAAYMNRVRMPFNVSSVGQAAAIAALDDEEHVRKSRETNERGLAQLFGGLSRMGLAVTPSAGNFVLVDVARPAGPVYEALLKKGVIVRPLAPYGLANHLRVSVGTSAENERALAAFGQVLAG